MEQIYLLQFQKIDGARFLSHLDMARLFIRAFRRTKLPLKFSEGFHAHPRVRFSPPLSVGVESLTEDCIFTLLDETRSEEALLALLAEAMPDGFVLNSLTKLDKKPAPTERARYEITFRGCVAEVLKKAFSAPMVVTKRTKSGEKEIDLLPHLTAEDIREDGSVTTLTLVAPFSDTLTINPTLILTALSNTDPTLCAVRILKTAALRN